MNDELPEEQRPQQGSATSSSRWAVAPGSVVKSLKDTSGPSTHAADQADDSATRSKWAATADDTKAASIPRGRSAADILAESRARRDLPTVARRRSERAGSTEQAEVTGRSAEQARRSHGDAPSPASAYSTAEAPRSTTAGTDIPGARRGSATRVKPDLGEARELRQPPTAGTGPSTVLAGFGGVILIIITAGIGALIDHMVSSKLGVFTGIGLCIGAFFAALVTRKLDLLSVIVAPPIVYALFGVLLIWLSPTTVDKYSLAEIAIAGFPWMALATGIALLIGGVKLMTTRPTERR
ncbi:hypothetical protein CLV47_11229 [Antricoccus suffuscus]|uniref:DUF6542 domain-containing protein n=1 Tax=Antricoccus suffuscus TaxID=1629062 RepID=A0A2T0ZXB5_9ACTN|nr:DUF6542 domain-containing protein [Antricoccus suffuscus]PRZ40996.1 hypothetical protein CLV47_11229 [Antricoccus suffuscus]